MNITETAWPDDGVILYDGVCVLCSGWVRFVAKRDPEKLFRFTAIQSPYGQKLALALGIDPVDPDTNAVVLKGLAYRQSDAAIAVVSALPRLGWVRSLRIFPRPLRDLVYQLIARNRYRIFGRYDACEVPGPDLRARILDHIDPPQTSPAPSGAGEAR